MLGNITIRYIIDTQHLNIIHIISYFDIFPFFCIISITTYIILFYSAYTVPLDPPVVYSLVFTIHLLFLRPINCDYSQLSFDYISYSSNNVGKLYVIVIYIHKGKCNSLIFILLIFCLSHLKHVQDKTSWLLLYSYTSLKIVCGIGQFLINTVLIVTSFVWGQHCVFVIDLVTCECNILILQQLWFSVCHRY